METHSGDTPINRFFSFWGAMVTFFSFGILVLLFVAFESTLMSSNYADPDHARRTEWDTASLAAQDELVNGWKKNADGTYQVPATKALQSMTNKLSKPTKSAVPVPGTKAAEKAAAAAAAAVPPAAAAEPETTK
ncbi:MAG: hypothetical protein ACI8T1_000372 [Verrucomicrobiales bacterium]|jgi:hypothetical protein